MIKLYAHQEQALARLRMNDQYMLSMDQGTGKTLPTLWHIRDLLKNKKAKNALIVCPKAVVGSWHRDIDKFDDADREMLNSNVEVVTYDMVWRREEYNQRDWSIIVLDEAHKIKNRASKRADCLLNMATRSKYRYELTGTPISNGQLENLWSEMTFLFPVEKSKEHRNVSSAIFGTYYEFLNKYCYLNQWHQPYSYKNVDELQWILKRYSFRVMKEECLDLPEKLPDEIYDIELIEKAKYKELMKESAIEDIGLIADNGLARMTKLRTLCSGFLKVDNDLIDLRCEKEDAFEDFLEDYGGGKLVVFAEYRFSISRIIGVLMTRKIPFLVLAGDTKDKSCWRQFQTDPNIDVIVCQYQSANAGIDLYAADTMLFWEPCLSSNILLQSKDRIHRIGQHRPCRYVHFITKGTIERKIYDTLQTYGDFGVKLFQEYIGSYTKGYKL